MSVFLHLEGGAQVKSAARIEDIWESQEQFPIELKGYFVNVAYNEVELVAEL